MTADPADLVGQSIAHYRILSKLGEGGMGEVYRAADERLQREVAIKVLPPSFAVDAERLARFEREAQLLAALNHPRIAQVYGLESDGDRHAIVLELVEGETLAERIERGPMGFEEAREIALQIAQALEAAHESGIVHRDLKPANVKITPKGEVKVLDFGLAKATRGDSSGADLSLSPTMTAAATQLGVLLGTAAYMAPEQARGRPVDRRADVWAFACVLYEMLVGEKAFAGSDVTEMLARIVMDEPDLARLPSDLPPRIVDVLERSFRKDPTMRVPDVGVVRIALIEAGESSPNDHPTPLPDRRSLRAAVLSAALVVGLVGLALGWLLGRSEGDSRSGTPGDATHWDLVLDPPTEDPVMALSPDGGTLFYSAREDGTRRLFRRSLDGYETEAIPGTEGGNWPFVSPDGSRLGFFAAGRLKTVGVDGGLPLVLCGVPGQIYGAVWNGSEEIVFSSNSVVIPHRVPATGGDPVPVSLRDLGEDDRVTSLGPLPEPGTVLITVTSPSFEGPRVGTLDLASGEWQALARGSEPLFLPPDRLLFLQGEQLMALDLDPGSWSSTGPERPVVLPGLALRSESGLLRLSAAIGSNGLIVYPSGTLRDGTELAWLSRDGSLAPTGLLGGMPRLDPLGSRVVINSPRNEGDLELVELESGTSYQLTFSGEGNYPVWSSDGRRIVFSGIRAGRWTVFSIAADGSGEPRELSDGERDVIATSFGTGGDLMVYSIDPGTSRDVGLLRADGTFETVLGTKANERAGVLSPADALFAYVSDEKGVDEVFVREIPDSGRSWQVSEGGGLSPVWSPNGREIFYLGGDTVYVASVETRGGVRVGTSEAVYTSARLERELWGNQTFDVAPDGRLLISLQEASDVGFRVITSWQPGLE